MKAMNTEFKISLLACFMTCVIGQQLKNHVSADKTGTYHIFWELNGENMTFECQVATKGYVGFGFSPNGGMPGSDVIIGWVSNGQAYFQDRHALGFYEPLIDRQQNYHLLQASENETHTVLRFTRKLNTCDKENDTVITDNSMKFIYSWHPDDPKNITGLPYHGPDRRGAKDVLLLSPQPPPIQITDDITIWDVQMPNVSVPPKLTTYWCLGVKLPSLTVPHYYIGYTVHITPGNENIVHHFDLYQCRGNLTYFEEQFEKRKEGYECAISGEVSDPLDCQPAMIIWVVGAQGQTLPEGIGIPVGGDLRFFLIQMHYNNPERKSGIVDSSILRLYLTKKDVPNKAAMLTMYANFDYTLLIPPQQPAFKVETYCPSECTAKSIPEEGVTVFAVGLHTHLAGRKLSVRHYRGNKELKPIAVDNNFNFNYQEMRQLSEPVTILPGDMLMGTCVYSSMDRNETVVGGLGTDEEMCFFYLSYYPETDLTICIGGPNYVDLFDYFEVEEVAPDNVRIIAPESLKNQSMFDRIKHYDWTKVNDTKLQRMITMQYDGVKNFTCQGDPKNEDTHTTVLIGYPADIPPYVPPPDVACDFVNTTTTQTPKMNVYNPGNTTPKTYEEPKLDEKPTHKSDY